MLFFCFIFILFYFYFIGKGKGRKHKRSPTGEKNVKRRRLSLKKTPTTTSEIIDQRLHDIRHNGLPQVPPTQQQPDGPPPAPQDTLNRQLAVCHPQLREEKLATTSATNNNSSVSRRTVVFRDTALNTTQKALTVVCKAGDT